MTSQSTPPTDDSPQRNYFVRHWQGELPLALSFWLNGFALWLALSFAIIELHPHNWLQPVDDWYWLRLFLIVAQYPIAVWQIVGVWRSADRRDRRSGPTAWTTLAKVIGVLALFRILSGLVMGTYW